MKRYLPDYVFLFTPSGLIIALDQFTKWLVRTNLDLQEIWVPWHWLAPYARIVNWKNTGIAFGMLQDLGKVFMVLSFLVSIAIIYYFPRIPKGETFIRIALTLQFGGAVGNLIDRITQGYVTDFVSVGTFPVFNVADSSISIGVVVLLIGMWIKEYQEKKKLPASQVDPEQKLAERLPEDAE